MDVPKYAVLTSQDVLSINYLCNIRTNKDFNIKYFEERKHIVLRNCDQDGNLCDLKLPKYKYLVNSPWVLLSVKEFTDLGEVYSVPICRTCSPLYLDNITTEQSPETIAKLLCHHAKVAANIIRDFTNPFTLDGWLELSEDDDELAKVEVIHKKEDKTSKTQHLAQRIFSGC